MISVVMPVFNGERFLAQAMASLRKPIEATNSKARATAKRPAAVKNRPVPARIRRMKPMAPSTIRRRAACSITLLPRRARRSLCPRSQRRLPRE